MVDVTSKPITVRTATAAGQVWMRRHTADMIRAGDTRKGDVLTVARIAAISATKLTHLLIPLCHSLAVEAVNVRFSFAPDDSDRPGTPNSADSANALGSDADTGDGNAAGFAVLHCEVDVRSSGKTGVEMEALAAVMAGCLTVYDMCKSVDRGMRIHDVRVTAKSGGASGNFTQ